MMRWRSGMGRSYRESGRTRRNRSSVTSRASANIFIRIFTLIRAQPDHGRGPENADADYDPGHIIGNQLSVPLPYTAKGRRDPARPRRAQCDGGQQNGGGEGAATAREV